MRLEQPLELGIGVIAQLAGEGCGIALNPQELKIGRHLHDLVRRKQIAPRNILRYRGRIAGLVALRLIACSFLTDHLAQPLGRFQIIHPKDLLHSSIGLAALRAVASKDRGADRDDGDIRDRLARIVGREEPEAGGQSVEEPSDLRRVNDRLRETLGLSEGVEADRNDDGADKPSIRERLEGVLNKPRETLDRGDDRDAERDRGDEKENTREIDREIDRDPGLSH